MNQTSSDDELTPEEVAAFVALPRATSAHDQLAEERTVQALRANGLLAVPGRRRTGHAATIGLGIAASLTLFVGGAMYGKRLASREAQAASPSMQVQQAGTAYVAALVRLSRASDTERSPGVEAGAATLRAAANSLAQIDPADPIATRIRNSLGGFGQELYVTGDRAVIWF